MTSLNSEQAKAVHATDGPVLILAGAGAGKTRVIVERICQLIRQGVAPGSILAITFTNKAAKEMRERVSSALENDLQLNFPISQAEKPFVSTFHSLGVYILREQSHLAGLKKTFAIFDRDDSKKAIKEAMQSINLDPKTHDPGKILGIISKEKGRGRGVEEYLERGEWRGYTAEIVANVWPQYERILKRDSALDFDDLLLKTLHLLRRERSVRDYYRNIWKYIHIDEYQDTNGVQYEISKLLVGDDKNICAVGDIDQNIYSWRGAELKNILAFEDDYPNALVITLEKNYRSTKNILEAANHIIEKNKYRRPKNLFTENHAGEKIFVKSNFDEASEAGNIALESRRLIGSGVTADNIAVLYRANFQSRILEEAFLRNDVPYQVLGTRFFERREVKDIISYLRAAWNEDSLADLKRIINTPTRGIGKATIAKIFSGDESGLPSGMRLKWQKFKELLQNIKEFSNQNKLSETIIYIIKNSGLEEEFKSERDEGEARLENAYELGTFASRYDHLEPEQAVLQFLTDSALQSDQDEMREEVPAVRLMTVHAAKGLEFDIVFIAGLEEGLFPHERMGENNLTPEEAEEERRLFYVALTRARKKVYLSYAQLRTIFGRQQVNMPSEFILDIPEELIEEESGLPTGRQDGKRPLLDIDF